jgi:DNA-binding CsgD family transcriptional regulator
MTSQLKTVDSRQLGLERALDWLSEGVALLRTDGYLAYAKEAFCALARHSNGFRIIKNTIEFTTPELRHHFSAALNTVRQICDNPLDMYPTDFPVPRHDGLPAYTVALRPLVCSEAHAFQHTSATVMVLIHDPLARNVATSQMLQKMFDLTGGEANLAQALCAGMTTNAYASTRRVTLNTVYTHLRRIREKTSCNSVAELVRKFGELNVPLRLSR